MWLQGDNVRDGTWVCDKGSHKVKQIVNEKKLGGNVGKLEIIMFLQLI